MPPTIAAAATQRELAHVVRVLFEEYEAATRSGTQKWNKQGRILKLVLYGSYARGDWVSDTVGGYQSDYDILVVVNDERLTDFVDYWSPVEDRLMRDLTINKAISAPVNLIVHSLTDVNAQLERGRPFFVDIATQGVALYEAEGFDFAAPRRLPPDEARAEARVHFEQWFASASRRIQAAKMESTEGQSDPEWRKDAAFTLHQAVERLYHCTLLVYTLYSPKSHNLNFLRSHCEDIVPALKEAWPREGKFERRCFELLRLAYVNARYSDHYAITDEELTWAGEHVAELQALIEAACTERLPSDWPTDTE